MTSTSQSGAASFGRPVAGRLLSTVPTGGRSAVRNVGSVETIDYVSGSSRGAVTVATGLMSLDQPTVPASDNPWATRWWQTTWLFVVAGIGALLLVLLLRRRLRG